MFRFSSRSSKTSNVRRQFQVESLECRELFAADVIGAQSLGISDPRWGGTFKSVDAAKLVEMNWKVEEGEKVQTKTDYTWKVEDGLKIVAEDGFGY